MTREIDNLAANMLTGVASPTLLRLLANREAKKTLLEYRLSSQSTSLPTETIIPHPELRRLFREKVARLHETLDNAAVHGEAAEILSTLIESVTIYPEGEYGREAKIVARVANLLGWATNDNAAPEGGVRRSTAVVAGTRFHLNLRLSQVLRLWNSIPSPSRFPGLFATYA